MTKVLDILEANKNISCILNLSIDNIGNSTKLILDNREAIVIHKSISSVLREIAEFYSIDLKLLRKKQQTYTNSKYYVPLPITKDLLLIPIKTKAPLVPKDPSISYINYYYIKEIDKHKPIIHLKNGLKIKSLNSLETLKKRLSQANICNKLNTIPPNSNPSNHYPVTRGDLEKLKEEILTSQIYFIEKLFEDLKE